MNDYFLSESCFVYNLSNKLDSNDNIKILKIYKDILYDDIFRSKYQIFDIVPTYNSIAFHTSYFDMLAFKKAIQERISIVNFNKEVLSKCHYIDVVYNGEDLEYASDILGLSKDEIITRHSQAKYKIAILGFKPYFPYLLGLDKSISLPRLETPRNRVAKGSVGIGGSQTSVFPLETPSGWNIIGITDFDDFSSFSPGDTIIFRRK